jgi:hypothetical protein
MDNFQKCNICSKELPSNNRIGGCDERIVKFLGMQLHLSPSPRAVLSRYAAGEILDSLP